MPASWPWSGVEKNDSEKQADRLLERLLAYRIFDDEEGRMNLDLRQAGGELLLVSQFTLAATTNKGNRPGFSSAAPPDEGAACLIILSPGPMKRWVTALPASSVLICKSAWSMTDRSPSGSR